MHGKILSPRIPSNFFTEYGYEDTTIPRVCFSETIDGALAAIGKNLQNARLYVYRPTSLESVQFKRNKEVIPLVPDALYTKECWVMEAVELSFVQVIVVLGCKSEPTFFDYGDPTRNQGEVFFWNWKSCENKERR